MTWFSGGTVWRFTQGGREKRLCVSRTDNRREGKRKSISTTRRPLRRYPEGSPRANGGLFFPPAPLPFRILWQVSHTTTAIGFLRLFSPFSFWLHGTRLLLRAQPAFADSFIGISLSPPFRFCSPLIPRRTCPPFIVSVSLLPRGYSFLLSRKIQSVRARRIQAASP